MSGYIVWSGLVLEEIKRLKATDRKETGWAEQGLVASPLTVSEVLAKLEQLVSRNEERRHEIVHGDDLEY